MQYFADLFWKRWLKEYLPELQRRQRWLQPQRNLQEGDVVLIVDDTTPRNSWPMGRVQQVHLDKKGFSSKCDSENKINDLDETGNEDRHASRTRRQPQKPSNHYQIIQ